MASGDSTGPSSPATATRSTEHGSASFDLDDPLDMRLVASTVRGRLFGQTAEPVRIGRYRVLDRIGAGGLGVVYRAYDPDLDRSVALKIVAPHRLAGGGDPQARLVAEARAAAKLSDPHVVQVHDVGVFEEQVFFAMEHIDGVTLRTWLGERDRSVEEVVAIFEQAGKGLAAAHAAGLVHGDFKPDNVLIDGHGRAKVADFGLARPFSASIDLEATATSAVERSPSSTTTVTFAGTPAYLAPELFRGGRADPRSDQFAFGVALFEALHGAHPFAADSARAMADAITSGSITSEMNARVPAWIDHVVRRALRPQPDERFDSMSSLLAALTDDPTRRKRRRITVFAAGCTVALVGTGALAVRRVRAAECEEEGRRLLALWHGESRDAIGGRMRTVALPYAEATWERVAARLDGYTAALAGATVELCVAERVDGTLPADSLSVERHCLAEREAELTALRDVLVEIDAGELQHATMAALGLVPVESCEDPGWARANQSADAGADPEEANAVERMLARATALRTMGRPDAAVKEAEDARSRAHALGLLRLEARAAFEAGYARSDRGEFEPARSALEDAYHLAVRTGADVLAARSAARLVHVVGTALSRFDEANAWARLGWTSLHRAGLDAPAVRAELLTQEGSVLEEQGHTLRAVAVLGEALPIAREFYGDEHPETTKVAAYLASALRHVDPFRALPEALILWALRVDEVALGPDHPWVGIDLQNLAGMAALREDYQTALAVALRGLDIDERTLGPDSVALVGNIDIVARAQLGLGHFDDAQTSLERALDLTPRGSHSEVELRHVLAKVHLGQERPGEALQEAERALTILPALGFGHGDRTHQLLYAKALALWHLERREEAWMAAIEATSMRHPDPLKEACGWFFAATLAFDRHELDVARAYLDMSRELAARVTLDPVGRLARLRRSLTESADSAAAPSAFAQSPCNGVMP